MAALKLFIILALAAASSCCIHCLPTVAHSSEPFSIPPNTTSCIHHALLTLVKSISSHSVYSPGTRLEEETDCGRSGGALLRLTLFNSSAEEKPDESGKLVRQKYTSLLKDFRGTLKLRYEWAVIMNGHYWMEYHTRNTMTEAKTLQNSAFNESAAEIVDCLPRGDVLVSHNKAAGADPGFDVLSAPHSLVSQNDEYFLLMQGDCNLVLYTASGMPLWSSRTRDRSTKCSLSLLLDGNLVITDGNNKNIWESGSSIACPSVFVLILQNDGNAVIYNILSGIPIWATGTNQ